MNNQPNYAVVALDGSFRGGRGASFEERAELEPASQQAESSQGLLLHYRIPQYLEGRIGPGHLVAVTLRGRPAYGVVVELADTSPVQPAQPITQLVDARLVVQPAMLDLAR